MNKVIADKKYHLFLDDERIPNDVTWIELPLVEWTIVRNYNEFINCIKINGIPSIWSADHDLSDLAYQEYHRMINDNKIINYDNISEKTGYHCAQFLANYCIDNNHPIPIYYVHSMNPIGRDNIISVMESAKKIINKE